MACDGERSGRSSRSGHDRASRGRPPTIAGLADPSWLLGFGLAGGTPVLAGDRQAYRMYVARGAELACRCRRCSRPRWRSWTPARAHGPADVLHGVRPVRGRNCATSPGRRRSPGGHPADLPVTEDPGPVDRPPPGGPYRVGFPWKAAGAAAGQAATDVAKGAAKEAAKAAGDFLRRLSDR